MLTRIFSKAIATIRIIPTLKAQRDKARQQRDKAIAELNQHSVQSKDGDAWKKHGKRHERIGSIIQQILTDNHITSGKVLEIGGRSNPYKESIFKNYDYQTIDIKKTADDVIVADITHCPELANEQYDFIFSVDVFEHINAPWLAANEISRLLKPNGVTFHSTLFSWRYHPCPVDYWRFTPAALSFLFSSLKTTMADFDATERRRNITGQDKNKLKEDGFGGWRENWRVHYAGIKK
jgi:SAM-dependent methyltransferase